ncbi:hypothetical protein A2643_01500 [Candidatus Nomurabacteria bacterium RIFCSPHIGHO2_01_FULL_39_220]|uniref:Uncharacterized protein n=1 Tax=Candidatus Nomurabacteria bacterium RIFCSPLOWO2_02_FULL_40_67 TaxID=1801787 RepID=A0A1F6Y591_9BACT|nr:MAG: hypothetical protein A2W12_02235 [Candidatus Nomurabacteria bacterium RBG_16_40_11]OGI69933.1 MAG: hypothetical protein A2643_01500 [Candidatus Nomurabacteria bacterium RIFCSPHIGHO2_01_FULL_39_220]OGI73404.1 MAG: hypothetical protein A2W56_00900 [Candidatus Nomurabacteria bacterium RIFCSPHIGHO2_02_41_18]OGI78505.1 MAG: hypothetical protein A3C65_02615 [Candidatus Nomurabacteria bacterium RIFCSPHIGHO2_02_FULL_41_150]OGI81539.1 MAG: hypothetical protein A3E03_01880 [Candidatus Nomurabacte
MFFHKLHYNTKNQQYLLVDFGIKYSVLATAYLSTRAKLSTGHAFAYSLFEWVKTENGIGTRLQGWSATARGMAKRFFSRKILLARCDSFPR